MKLTKATIAALRPEIDAALEAVALRHNITLKAGNASFNLTALTANFKLELHVLNADGMPRDLDAEHFTEVAAAVGLAPGDLGKEISVQGRRFTIAGYRAGARKNAIKIKEVATGKVFTTDVATVKRALARRNAHE